MGGFVIRRSSPERAVPTTFPETGTDPQEPVPRTRDATPWKTKLRRRLGWKSKSDVAIAAPDAHEQRATENKEPSTAELGLSANESSQPVLIHLLTQDIVLLRSKGLLPKLPYITLEEINDKSKSDSLVRAITVVQLLWMVIQVIARAVRSLAITQLEIAVVAFATCAVIIYGVNWEKPKGVQVPITIISYPGAFPKDTMKIVERDRGGGRSLFSVIVFLASRFASLKAIDPTEDWPLGKPIPNVYNRFVSWMERMDDVVSLGDVLGLFLCATVFGAVHIAAWNFVFPTPVESLLWKIASLLCTTLGLAFGPFVILPLSFDIDPFEFIPTTLAFLFFVIYIVCRLFLVVEIFRCLCFLPPSAYISTWATNVPHVS
jgi:hypothetical protein